MIWNPFAGNQESRIGIDIGTASIKVVELAYHGEKATLRNYAQFSTDGDGNSIHYSALKILDTQVVEILKRMFEKAAIDVKEAAISIPLFSSFSTLIELPSVADDDLERAVRYEARKHIPVPLNEVQLDWLKVDHLSSPKSTRVLVVAVPTEIIQQYHNIAKALGLTLRHIELETFSAARALVRGDTKPVAVLDIGSRTTNLSIVEKGLVILHHNIDVSGFGFTRTLSRGLAVDLERADKLKRSEGLRSEGQVVSLVAPLVDKIIDGTKKIMDDYMHQRGSRVQTLILSGGSSAMPGLPEYLERGLGMKIALGDPFAGIIAPEPLEELLKGASEFTVAVGLALRS
jgi:type IV pilus assembly protein PilM